VSKLYAADLIGSSLGCLLLIYAFEKKGWSVSAPGEVKGISGVAHNFSAVASINKGGISRFIAVDIIAQTSKIDVAPVIALFAKIMDVKPNDAFLLSIPGLDESASKLANTYRIRTIEGKDLGEVISKLTGEIPQI